MSGLRIIVFLLGISAVFGLRIRESFLTVNSSYNHFTLSTSLATNIEGAIVLYSPLLIEQNEHEVQLVTHNQKKFEIIPEFIKEEEFLYNDYTQGEYWYGFKKSFVAENPRKLESMFSYVQASSHGELHQMLMPLFGLPLGFIDINRLYKCQNVVISYQQTESFIDLTVFSEKEKWHLFPKAKWGFRQREQDISYSRQTYPIGTKVEVDIGEDKYCSVNGDLQVNEHRLNKAQDVYQLKDLLGLSLQLKVQQFVKGNQDEL